MMEYDRLSHLQERLPHLTTLPMLMSDCWDSEFFQKCYCEFQATSEARIPIESVLTVRGEN